MKPFKFTYRSTILQACIKNSKQIYIVEKVRVEGDGKRWLDQRWSKNDDDLRAIAKDFIKIYRPQFAWEHEWHAITRDRVNWYWTSAPFEELEADALATREKRTFANITKKQVVKPDPDKPVPSKSL
jgi:hypothetical protein